MNKENESLDLLNEKTKDDLIKIVNHKTWEYSIPEIVEWMKDKGYEEIGELILEALVHDIFSISSIDNDGMVWLELGSEGEEIWENKCKGKEGFSE